MIKYKSPAWNRKCSISDCNLPAPFFGSRCQKHQMPKEEKEKIKKAKKGTPEIKVCRNCNIEFKVKRPHKPNIYCCAKCKFEYCAIHTISVKCNWCGNSFKTGKGRIRDGRGKYCSKKCCYAVRTVIYAREGNPNWKGIKRHLDRIRRSKIGKKWTATIKSADKCSVCNKTDNLQAHHIIQLYKLFLDHVKCGDAYDSNDPYFHDLNNGICVCKDCHADIHPKISVMHQH